MAKQQSRASSGRYVSRLTSGALAVVMAGGRGERLKDLTLHRCKPATPFGGKFRIIDFVLSNCVNSGIRQIFLMTQYKGQSLIQHVQRGWSYLRGEFGEFIDVVPAQQQVGVHWYRGTADCVYQNIELIRALHPKHVLVLAGDHIYKMDYGPMIAYHVEKGADITVGVVEVPPETARDFGVLSVTDWNRVTKFTEKPKEPETIPSRPDVALASMGIYVFNARLLEKLLIADATDDKSAHDFGKNVIPAAIDLLHVAAYPFTDVKTRAQAYWRDVGTVERFLRCQYRAGARRARTQSLRRRVADLDLSAASAAGQVCARRGRPSRHCGRFHGLGRLHYFRRPRQSVAALLQCSSRGAIDYRARGGAAERQDRCRLCGGSGDSG